jgi:hypothetical protein
MRNRFGALIFAVVVGFVVVACKDPAPPPPPVAQPLAAAPPARIDAGVGTPAQALLDAAEALHHFAGEEPTDDQRAAFLAERISENEAKVKELLPKVRGEALPPGVLVAIRLLYDPAASPELIAKWCSALPSGDFMESLIDDEAREVCSAAASSR